MSSPQPSQAAAAWAEDVLGGPCRFHWRGSEEESSRVWTATAATGRQAFLKELSSARKHEQERVALGAWAPRLPGVMPRLLGASDEPRALLVEALPGRPGDRALGSLELELAAHRAAGAALGRLHALAVEDDDDMTLAEALPRRLGRWLDTAAQALASETCQAVRESFGDGSIFDGLRRVPCHRDVEPRNWIVEIDESRLRALRLVDFEHARLDCPLVDFVKLDCRAWVGRPELRAEFFEGHGGALGEQDEDRLRRLALLHLVATFVQAAERGDHALARWARESLEARLS